MSSLADTVWVDKEGTHKRFVRNPQGLFDTHPKVVKAQEEQHKKTARTRARKDQQK